MKKTSLVLISLLVVSCTTYKNKKTVSYTNAPSEGLSNKLESKVNKLPKRIKSFNSDMKVNNLMSATKEVSLTKDGILRNAKPGQCFAKVVVPAKYKNISERVMVKAESTKYTTTPAKYAFVTKKVLVKESFEKLVTIPATYKTVTERVMVQEESEVLRSVPAVYKTVTKKIQTAAATTEWKRGNLTATNKKNTEGALCLVKKPAQYKTVTEKVLVTPETFNTTIIPAKYKTVKRTVVDVPASVKKVTVPAVYKTVKVKTVIEAPQRNSYVVPAKFQTITKKVKTSNSRTEWNQILCKTNADFATVSKVQTALKKSGFNPGKIDGILGENTSRAIESFQRNNGLATGGLTMDTLKSLNISASL